MRIIHLPTGISRGKGPPLGSGNSVHAFRRQALQEMEEELRNKGLYEHLLPNSQSQTLTDWLCQALPETAEYSDVANLCMSLFCTVEFLPAHLHDVARTKERLAESFAELSRRRFSPEFGKLFWSYYGAGFHRPTDIGHWLEVMASVRKLARQPDIASAASLIRHAHDTSTNVA